MSFMARPWMIVVLAALVVVPLAVYLWIAILGGGLSIWALVWVIIVGVLYIGPIRAFASQRAEARRTFPSGAEWETVVYETGLTCKWPSGSFDVTFKDCNRVYSMSDFVGLRSIQDGAPRLIPANSLEFDFKIWVRTRLGARRNS
jgi:hypothetical protein